jgi:hypothetical protein
MAGPQTFKPAKRITGKSSDRALEEMAGRRRKIAPPSPVGRMSSRHPRPGHLPLLSHCIGAATKLFTIAWNVFGTNGLGMNPEKPARHAAPALSTLPVRATIGMCG